MHKKLTISIDSEVYNGLHTVIGKRRISKFIEDLVKPHVLQHDLYSAYKAMSEDATRESEALEWTENLIGDANEER